jgi:hypothetical protein
MAYRVADIAKLKEEQLFVVVMTEEEFRSQGGDFE